MFTLCFRPGGFMTLVEISSTYITMEGIAPPFILTFLVPKHKKIDVQIWRKDDFEWISQNGFWRYQSTDPIHSSCDQLVICFSHTKNFLHLLSKWRSVSYLFCARLTFTLSHYSQRKIVNATQLPTAKCWWHHVARSTLPQGLFSDSPGTKQGKAGGARSQRSSTLSTTRKARGPSKLRSYLGVMFCSKGVDE